MMTLRQALPLQAPVFGTLLLPPNQTGLRLELVQLIPTGAPSASLSRFVTQASLERPCQKGCVQLKARET